MNVLLIGDVAHTGFGRVTRELAAGLMANHDVRVIGINHRGIAGELEAAMRRAEGSLSSRLELATAALRADPLLDVVIPASERGDGMGHNLTAPALDGALWPMWRPDALIMVADPKAMLMRLSHDGGALGRAVKRGVRLLNYVPIEGTGLPESFRILWDHVTPIAMSDFGQTQLEVLLERPVERIWHGVSPTFRPITAADPGTLAGQTVTSRDGAKRAIGMAGHTVVLRTDRFIFRKNYPALFRVMRPVAAAHPEVITVIHTPLVDDDGRGDIRELISREPGAVHETGIEWAHPQIHLTRAHDSFKGISDDALRVLYSAADLYVSPTMAEGFGLCLAEALACGTPVVATDYSAVSEVVGPGGVLIPPRDFLTNAYAHEWALVDEAAMSAAVERLISKPGERRSLGTAGRQHVARFSWTAAVEQFDRLLSQPAAIAA